MRANAPALAAGVLDYCGLLDECGTQFDFFDSRGHLATVPGPEFADKAWPGRARLPHAVWLPATGSSWWPTTPRHTSPRWSGAASRRGSLRGRTPPAPSWSDSAGVRHLRAAIKVLGPKLVVVPAAAAVAVPMTLALCPMTLALCLMPFCVTKTSPAGEDGRCRHCRPPVPTTSTTSSSRRLHL